ncbi:MAG: hypothetical protein HY899_00560 [Deltaproteobacteria bacterium]|nr:hypothetical protein [Deltaproteobacteria bacterium]
MSSVDGLRVLAFALVAGLLATEARAGLGADLALKSEFCLYADCNARQAWVAHEWGQSNAATLVEIFDYWEGGKPIGLVSGGWFGVNAGDVEGTIGSGSAALAWVPIVVQFNYASAALDGAPVAPAGTELDLETTRLSLSVAVDLERAASIKGLSIGIIGYIPVATDSLELTADIPNVGTVPIARSNENVAYNLSAGVLWETGRRDWLRLGAYLNGVENDSDTTQFDPTTGAALRLHQTSNLWFGRVGTSVRPFIPLGLAAADNAWSRYRGEIKVSADLRVTSISSPGEGVDNRTDFFAGVDALLVPDHWNPLSRYVGFFGVTGVGTDGSWGAGLGLYGRGALEWLTCDTSYSRAPGRSLAENVEIRSIACAAWLPVPW